MLGRSGRQAHCRCRRNNEIHPMLTHLVPPLLSLHRCFCPHTAIAKAEEIVSSLGSDGMLLQQFNNPDNPKVCGCETTKSL